jgi:hypothetical protein
MDVRLLLCAVALLASPAWAHDPYTSWYIPGTKISCCNSNDCQVADGWRMAGNGYEVLVEGAWCPVPQDRVLSGVQSPPGDGHVCIASGSSSACTRITCFLPGMQY